jgi:transposase
MACVDPAGLPRQPARPGPGRHHPAGRGDGRPGRFPNGGAVKACTGLTPRANQTGQTDRTHQPMTKAGPRALRSQLVQSADTARKLDPSSPRSTTPR